VGHTRTSLLEYAAETYEELADFADVDPTDSVGGHKLPLDQTFAALGRETGAYTNGVVADEYDEAAIALLDYYELLRFSKKLATRRDADVSGAGGVAFKRRTERVQLREDLEDAKERCEALGFNVKGSGFKSGSIMLDYLEPSDDWD
jgi:hypothetical protein